MGDIPIWVNVIVIYFIGFFIGRAYEKLNKIGKDR